MCMKVECPNHPGKASWWGCGAHIEQALSGVPQSDRCKCEHEEIPGQPGKYQVKKLPELSAQDHQNVQAAKAA